MRLIERIPQFLELVNWEKLIESWFPTFTSEIKSEIVARIHKHIFEITKLWVENPDWRISQVLVNGGVIPNHRGFWYYEEEDKILINQGCEAREVSYWGTNFDKDMNRLPKTIWRPIKDLTTDHIEAILAGGFTKNPTYLKLFNEELTRRKDE